jgi:ferredoxin
VNQDRCAGSGLCAAHAADHFRLDEGRSRPTRERIEPADAVLAAVDLCLAEAITVHDSEDNLLAPWEGAGNST